MCIVYGTAEAIILAVASQGPSLMTISVKMADMFERYDEHARHSIFFARYEASQSGSLKIDALHLLLGLLRATGSIFALANPQVSVNDVIETCRRAIPAGEKTSTSVDMPLSEECKQALEEATTRADAMRSREIRPIHLALGLILASSEVALILKSHGITAANLAIDNDIHPEAPRVSAERPALLEFVCQGQLIATSPVNFVNPLPRTGDELNLNRNHRNETYKVVRVQHHFEGPPITKTMAHCWLVKVVIEVEAIGPPPEMAEYT